MQIEDGFGSGCKAKIDCEGRLSTLSTEVDLLHVVAHEGVAFSLTQSAVSLTSGAGESGLIYFTNTGDVPIHVSDLVLSSNATTRFKIYRNPTTGTLISAGTTLAPVNLNFGSGRTLDATVLKGVNGSTVTNGGVLASINNGAGVYVRDIKNSYIINRGDSLAITATPSVDTVVDISLFIFQSASDTNGH